MPDDDLASQNVPEETREPDADGHERCVEIAWQLLAEGVYTWRAIARGVNERTGCSHAHHWAKRAIAKHSQIVAETFGSKAIDHRAKYLQGLHTDLAALALLANNAEAEFARISARTQMVKVREMIAAASGVVTKRDGHELTGANRAPLRILVREFTAEEIASYGDDSNQRDGSGD